MLLPLRLRASLARPVLLLATATSVLACGTAPESGGDERASDADDEGGAPETQPETQQPSPEAMALLEERAVAQLVGRFDSSDQSVVDPRYYAVQLRSCRVALPALGEHVVYVEQAMVDAADQPYRQRIYVVHALDEQAVASDVHELARPELYVGFCDVPEADRGALAPPPEQIIAMTGCRVTLQADGEGFTGATDADSCLNDYNGATYATSEVVLRDSGIESWDRGYDANGAQVWGTTAGAYRFDRKE
jgi:hypothetical protein